MNTLVNTSNPAGMPGDAQVINPANNLPDVPGVDDATVTRGDVKNAGTQAQTENNETAEKINDLKKVEVLQQLRKFFDGVKLSATEFNETEYRAKFNGLGLDAAVINAAVSKAKKLAESEISYTKFLKHLSTNETLKNNVVAVCGSGCLDAANICAGDKMIIRFSDNADNDKTAQFASWYNEQNNRTYYAPLYVQFQAPSVSSIINAIKTFSLRQKAIDAAKEISRDANKPLHAWKQGADVLIKNGYNVGSMLRYFETQGYIPETARAAFAVAVAMMENSTNND